MNKNKLKVIVIGGGPAGIMAAGTAAERGMDVILIEKNEKLGKKLYITGKGRCNITNNTDIEGLISNIPVNGKFMYSALYTFSNSDLIDFFNKLGLKTKVERGGRVFPASDKSSDVIKALTKFLNNTGVTILRDEVKKVVSKNNVVSHVELSSGKVIKCDRIIIATGGASYPVTGSTGDGYRFAKENGHKVTKLRPSLISLETKEAWIPKAQGLSLKNISITLSKNGRKIYDDFGEMIFTHFGISGPVILSASCYIKEPENNNYMVTIDLKPALSLEELDTRVQRDFDKYSRKIYANALGDLLPSKLIPIVIELSKICPEKPVNQITRTERTALVKLLKNLTTSIKGLRPLNEAIITSGGVSVDEIDPGTMESKLVKGLFFAGEVIDVDGYTGGFNLQIAFSTGYLAGLYC